MLPTLGCQGCGCKLASFLRQSPGAAKGRSPTGRSARFTIATRLSAAAVSKPSTRSICAVQLGAPAHDPSSAITRSPAPPRLSDGFRTGPAKPTIRAATAIRRSSKSHQGVRSVWLSASVRPSKSATPGKRRLIGAGGTARRNSQRIGSVIRPSKRSGLMKPRGPSVHIIGNPLWQAAGVLPQTRRYF